MCGELLISPESAIRHTQEQREDRSRLAVDFDAVGNRPEAIRPRENQANGCQFLGWTYRPDLDDWLLGNADSDVGVLHRESALCTLNPEPRSCPGCPRTAPLETIASDPRVKRGLSMSAG